MAKNRIKGLYSKLPRPKWLWGLLLCFACVPVIGYLGLWFGVAYLATPHNVLAQYRPIAKVVYQTQGWGQGMMTASVRQLFYYTPQGTSLHNLRTSWFANLEQPLGPGRFAAPENMTRLGFLVDAQPTVHNPHRLPVGFTSHRDEGLRDDVLDITCAACHTGELNAVAIGGENAGQHVGIRIDGGEAPHAFTDLDPGKFGASLVSAMLATAIDPWKFNRLAQKVLGRPVTFSSEVHFYWDFWSVLAPLMDQALFDSLHRMTPVEEGYGRTDAVGRIANHVFGDEIDRSNSKPTNAPVSYPALWDIWKFDWVQYTASVAQPLARNMGETLGVGAELALFDWYQQPVPKADRYESSAMVQELTEIESYIRALRPPKWPEDILGPIERDKAEKGRQLYKQHCAKCHQPCEMSDQDRAVLVPGKQASDSQWHVRALPIEIIGTDPTAAQNFASYTYDLSKTGLRVEDVRPIVQEYWDTYFQRLNDFRQSKQLKPFDADYEREFISRGLESINIKSATVGQGLNYIGMHLRKKYYQEHGINWQQQADIDGFGALDLPEVRLQYKARPLDGVWATAPYLHNGSVPTLYDMLLPADSRYKKFPVGSREFDPDKVGLSTEALADSGFWLDTSIKGNWNIGHEFRKGYTGRPENGVIGPALNYDERRQIIEYLKVLDNSAPGYRPCTCPVDYTPPRWDLKPFYVGEPPPVPVPAGQGYQASLTAAKGPPAPHTCDIIDDSPKPGAGQKYNQ